MRMAEVDPYDVIEQALLMTDALGREKVTVHVAKKIFKKNPEGIRDWLPQSGLSEASQQRIPTQSISYFIGLRLESVWKEVLRGKSALFFPFRRCRRVEPRSNAREWGRIRVPVEVRVG